jgi:hypothetical protein
MVTEQSSQRLEPFSRRSRALSRQCALAGFECNACNSRLILWAFSTKAEWP